MSGFAIRNPYLILVFCLLVMNDNDDILTHCRDEKQVHVRGCWVLDLVLGKM